jgi:hypothetical protein
MGMFLKQSGLGLLAIALTAAVGYTTLQPPKALAAQPAAAEVTMHTKECSVCRLPLFSQGAQPSRLGPESQAGATVTVSSL